MNLPSDGELAQIQLAAYEYDGTPFSWDWSTGPGFKNLHAGLKRLADGTQVVVMPGTGGGVDGEEALRQWALNFTPWPAPTEHKQFGWVDRGFYDELEAFVDQLPIDGALPIVGCGHSRGAAQIELVAGILLTRGTAMAHYAAFAPPRPGGQQFADYCAGLSKSLYRTVGSEWPYHDVVTDVPAKVEGEMAQHPGPIIPLVVVPKPKDKWFALRYHHMELYASALAEGAVS